MAKKQDMTADTLIPIGAEKLAEILLEIAANDKNVAKRLERLVSLRSGSDKSYTSSVQKQLSLLFRKGRYYDYYTTRNLAHSLDSIRNAIVSDLLAENPVLAAELLKDLIKRANQAIECADDSNGEIAEVFFKVADSLALAWRSVPRLDVRTLANDIFELMLGDCYYFTETLVENTCDVLGEEGLKIIEHLARRGLGQLPQEQAEANSSKQKIFLEKNADPAILSVMLEQMEKTLDSVEVYNKEGHRVLFGNTANRFRCLRILRVIADAGDNVDLFIESCTMSENQRQYSVEIAERLLKHHRPQEALEWLNVGDEGRFLNDKKANLKITALTTLGKKEEAQHERWNAFCKSMSEWFYIDYVDHSEKTEHEAIRAKAIAAAHDANFDDATRFLTWLRDAKALKHHLSDKVLDGRNAATLTAAADFLAAEEPEFAAKIYYMLITSVLDKGASKYYPDARNHLLKAENCVKHLENSAHQNFVAALKEKHGKKRTFWNVIKEEQSTTAD